MHHSEGSYRITSHRRRALVYQNRVRSDNLGVCPVSHRVGTSRRAQLLLFVTPAATIDTSVVQIETSGHRRKETRLST